LLSSLASELKAADKLKERGKDKPGVRSKVHQSQQDQTPALTGSGDQGQRVPEDGNLPIIVASRQELPTGRDTLGEDGHV
jgi:hypothetical protein